MPIGTFLNDAAVTQLRGLAWLALSDVGYVASATVTSDSGGGGTTVWANGSAIPCRIDPITGNEVEAASRISDRSTHMITVPPGTVVTVSSRFEITGRGTYEITAVQDRTGELAGFLEAVQVS